MYGGREALPDDHKFRGQRGRVRARYRRPQLGRGTEKIGETSQRKTNLQLASGHFLVKLRRSRRQVSARRKLHRAVDAQVATANSIPWSSTAKFSRNGVLVAPLRVSFAHNRKLCPGNVFTNHSPFLGSSASNRPASRSGVHCGPAGQECHRRVSDRRFVHASARPAVAK